MTQMIELGDKDFEMVITVFRIFKNVEERANVLKRYTKTQTEHPEMSLHCMR